MFKQNLILWAVLLMSLPMNAQNKEFPNAIHAKINLVDYGALYNGTTRVSQGFEFGYFRNIAPFLNAGVPIKMAVAKLPLETDNRVTTSFDLIFHLENIRETAKISPYLFGGGGVFIENFKKKDIHFPFGAGINFRISKFAFINLQGEFRKAMADNRDNVQFGAGFVYLLHKSEPVFVAPPPPLDTDKDSIPDLVDRCPDKFGPASALGCPDSDGDGLGDVEDQCPTEKGPLETLGCPDSDNDGLADREDKCPTEPGPIDGCPDTDKDGFANANDECPDVAGRWNGCPDTDFDGVPDKDDLCPTDPGKPENKGCPEKKDADGDGFDDADDKCPDVAGILNGCPDKDSDGVADGDDACPDTAGKLKGCPDTDEDGVADKDDPCPTVAGKTNGCPDTDEDGLADKDDPCPTTAGKINGCPDGDDDGVADKDDPCPTVAGKFGGCPDTDGDGVADNLDKCPTSPGTEKDLGCPEIKQETKEKLAFATKNVQFETGKATLKMESYAILDELFNILKQYPDYKLSISGHTDDVGNDEINLQLSSARAKACQDYMLFRGVNPARLRAAGFGESRPIAANTNNAGREMNRRVEFELVVF